MEYVTLSLRKNEVERLLQIVQEFGESSDNLSDKIFCYKALRALGFGNLKDEKTFSREIFKSKDVTREKYIVVLQSELDPSRFDYIGRISFAKEYDEAIKIGNDFVENLSEYPALAGYTVYKLIEDD